ncbi:restriction endonuclease [Brevibacillus centrosporus]|uniref:restriction endonuclease n=1 Tax=Brevibacillus centrosporus TaxID=54910 RepID=UPI003D1B6120
MSRRKKRRNSLDEILGVAVIAAALTTFCFTKSAALSGLVVLTSLLVIVLISILRSKQKQEMLKRSGITEIDKMDGKQFEHYLLLLFKSHGYSVSSTKTTGDFGGDLILQKNGKKIVVQAKRHGKNVGIEAVQQAQAAIAYYKADEAWVVSNRNYTKAAQSLAAANQVRLIDREELMEKILAMNPNAIPNAEEVRQNIPRKQEKCKVCGNPMMLRKSDRGEFLGCSAFPQCRNTKSLTS